MYSRAFSENGEHLPPHYGGTALRAKRHAEDDCRDECKREEEKAPPHECENGRPQADARDEGFPSGENCPPKHEPPCQAPGLPLPYGIRLEDLLLLGLAILLWLDGCEDEYLPLLLLFLLIVH